MYADGTDAAGSPLGSQDAEEGSHTRLDDDDELDISDVEDAAILDEDDTLYVEDPSDEERIQHVIVQEEIRLEDEQHLSSEDEIQVISEGEEPDTDEDRRRTHDTAADAGSLKAPQTTTDSLKEIVAFGGPLVTTDPEDGLDPEIDNASDESVEDIDGSQWGQPPDLDGVKLSQPQQTTLDDQLQAPQTNPEEAPPPGFLSDDDEDRDDNGTHETLTEASLDATTKANTASTLPLHPITITVASTEFLLVPSTNDSVSHLVSLYDDIEVLQLTIERFFDKIRANEDLREIQSLPTSVEMVLSVPELGALTITEDNIYSRDITVLDLVDTFEHLQRCSDAPAECPTSLSLCITTQPRFIASFNTLTDLIRRGVGYPHVNEAMKHGLEQDEPPNKRQKRI